MTQQQAKFLVPVDDSETYVRWKVEKQGRRKTSGKKRRGERAESRGKGKKKTNEIYIYKYKLRHENVK